MDTNKLFKMIDCVLKKADKVERKGNYKLGALYRRAALRMERTAIKEKKYISF